VTRKKGNQRHPVKAAKRMVADQQHTTFARIGHSLRICYVNFDIEMIENTFAEVGTLSTMIDLQHLVEVVLMYQALKPANDKTGHVVTTCAKAFVDDLL
jgi:hypothetical protein